MHIVQDFEAQGLKVHVSTITPGENPLILSAETCIFWGVKDTNAFSEVVWTGKPEFAMYSHKDVIARIKSGEIDLREMQRR